MRDLYDAALITTWARGGTGTWAEKWDGGMGGMSRCGVDVPEAQQNEKLLQFQLLLFLSGGASVWRGTNDKWARWGQTAVSGTASVLEFTSRRAAGSRCWASSLPYEPVAALASRNLILVCPRHLSRHACFGDLQITTQEGLRLFL